MVYRYNVYSWCQNIFQKPFYFGTVSKPNERTFACNFLIAQPVSKTTLHWGIPIEMCYSNLGVLFQSRCVVTKLGLSTTRSISLQNSSIKTSSFYSSHNALRISLVRSRHLSTLRGQKRPILDQDLHRLYQQEPVILEGGKIFSRKCDEQEFGSSPAPTRPQGGRRGEGQGLLFRRSLHSRQF
jgi:hypothetical protein